MLEMRRARYEGRGGAPILSGAPLSQHLPVFTILEALQTLSFWVFWRLHCVDMIDEIVGD